MYPLGHTIVKHILLFLSPYPISQFFFSSLLSLLTFLDFFFLTFFNRILFMLILTNDFLNFIEIMNWVFVIEISIFGCGNKVVEEVF